MQLPLQGWTRPRLSFDGYVRMPFDALGWLAFSRRSAWVDPVLADEFRIESMPATRAGYCEWETDGDITVSVGWAWFETLPGAMFIAPGDINSNLMLVTPQQYDLGADKTSDLLRAWLSGVKWQPEFVRTTY